MSSSSSSSSSPSHLIQKLEELGVSKKGNGAGNQSSPQTKPKSKSKKRNENRRNAAHRRRLENLGIDKEFYSLTDVSLRQRLEKFLDGIDELQFDYGAWKKKNTPIDANNNNNNGKGIEEQIAIEEKRNKNADNKERSKLLFSLSHVDLFDAEFDVLEADLQSTDKDKDYAYKFNRIQDFIHAWWKRNQDCTMLDLQRVFLYKNIPILIVAINLPSNSGLVAISPKTEKKYGVFTAFDDTQAAVWALISNNISGYEENEQRLMDAGIMFSANNEQYEKWSKGVQTHKGDEKAYEVSDKPRERTRPHERIVVEVPMPAPKSEAATLPE